MFTRFTILLFVFFAVAGLLHVAAPGPSSSNRESPDKTASAASPGGLTVDRIIADTAAPQP
jgi:hypothetical protein